MDFANSAFCIRCVMQYAVGIHNVKGVVREIKFLSVGGAKCPRQVRECETFTRELNRSLSQITTCVVSACLGKLCSIGAETAANFEYSFACCSSKVRRLWNMPFLLVTMLLD